MITLRLAILALLWSYPGPSAGQAPAASAPSPTTSLSEYTGTYARFAGSPREVSVTLVEGKISVRDSGGGGSELVRESDNTFRAAVGNQRITFDPPSAGGRFDSFALSGSGGSSITLVRTETLEAKYRETAGQLRPHAVSDAVLMGDEASLQVLIQAGADLNELDTRTGIAGRNGRRPLNWAAFSGRAHIVQLLLDSGADIGLTNRSGFTPLHHAAEAGSIEAARVLMERGADPLKKNARGQTALDVALFRSQREVIALLERAIAERNCDGEDCKAPALEASGYQLPEGAEAGLPVASLESVGADEAILARLLGRLEEGVFNQVDSLLIIKDGKLVVEQYYNDWSRDRAHMMQSVSKSVTSLLVGSAIHQGLLSSVEVPLKNYLPDHAELLTGDKAAITLKDLLTMSAGFDWNEAEPAYGRPGNIRGKEVFASDPVAFTLSTPFINEPGSTFTYSGGYVTVVGAILERIFKTDSVLDALNNSSLAKLGFKNLSWMNQGGGFQNTAGGVLMRPRDLAKIGQLMLNGGMWEGERLLPQEYVDASLAHHVSTPSDWDQYGYFWWGRSLTTDKATYEIDAARGWGGQELVVVKDLNLVVVLTATNYQTPTPLNGLLATAILPAFE